MIWVVYTVIAAILETLRATLGKLASVSLDNWNVVALSWLGALPVALVSLFFYQEIHSLSLETACLLLIVTVVDIVGTYCLMKGLSISDISIVMPILSMSPLYVAVVGIFVLGEFPSLFGLVGIFFVVLGAYCLNLDLRKESLFKPLKALFEDRGARLAFITVLFWGFGSTIEKKAILLTDPISWSIYRMLAMGVLCLGIYLKVMIPKKQKSVQNILHVRYAFIAGVAVAFVLFAQSFAFEIANTAYVVAIKRLYILLSVLVGWYVFKEQNMRQRLLGAGIMLLGVIIITIV